MNQFRLYIRETSPVMQFFLLIAVMLFAAGMIGAVGLLASKTFYGADWEAISGYITNPEDPAAAGPLKLIQLFNSLAIFLIPAMLFSQIFSPEPVVFMRLNRLPKALPTLLITLLFLAFTPVTDALSWLNNYLHLPGVLGSWEDAMRSSTADQQRLIGTFLKMETPLDFLYNLFLMAALPALGEEFFFRGIVQRLMIRRTKRIHLSVWVTGLAFAFMHQQFIAIIPLTVLGALLGYLKEWTGSLWASILAHFVNNATIIVVMFFLGYDMSDVEQLSQPNMLLLIGGMAASAALIFYLFKTRTKPLPENDDMDYSLLEEDGI